MPEATSVPRILVTREDPAPLAGMLAVHGGEPILLPLLCTRWLEFELPEGRTPDDYDWVAFTSARGLEALARKANERRWSWPPRARAAAVGGRTAHELQAQAWMPDCVAPESTARSLMQCLEARGIRGARVLFPASALADAALPEGLRAAGARVDVVAVYDTETAWARSPEIRTRLGLELAQALRSGCVATCASPSAARALDELAEAAGVQDVLRRTSVVALGPTTGAAVEALGLRRVDANGSTLACLARTAIEVARTGL